MTIKFLKKSAPIILMIVCGCLSKSNLTFYNVACTYLKRKSYLTTTRGSEVCAANCMNRTKCHGFSYYYNSNECLIEESAKAWKNASEDTWMRLPLGMSKAASSCPSDFVYDEKNNACFKVVPGGVQFDDARRRCAKAVHGGKIMSLDDPDKYNFVQTYLIKNKDSLRIGTWIRIGASRSDTSDEFTWENGQTLSLKDKQWCMYKPGNRDCLSLRFGTWGSCFDDSMCQAHQGILCENPAKGTIS